MRLRLESDQLEDYLGEIPPVIQYSMPVIQEKIKAIESEASTPKEKIRLAFELTRDEIHHSFDSSDKVGVTINANDVLEKKEGICFAKAHLLATLLRGMQIPAGFCYQRVLKKDTVESGYALHGLNAVYLEDVGWFRLDPRGNKTGIDSQFSIEEEKLAYTIHEDKGEIDYPDVFTKPLSAVVTAMQGSADSHELFDKRPELV